MTSWAVATLIPAALVLVVGWFTGVHGVFHGMLVIVAGAALFPLLVLALIAFLPALLIAVTSMFGLFAVLLLPGIAFVDVTIYAAWSARGLVGRYYAFWSRRHPLAWCITGGLVLGTGLLALLISCLILPGESRTVQILAQTRSALDEVYRKGGTLPTPGADGGLPRAALAGVDDGVPADANGNVIDGFGRPIHYQVSGRGKLAKFTLVSHGFDGQPGGDDLRLSHQPAMASLVSSASKLVMRIAGGSDADAPTKQDLLRAIAALRHGP